MSGTKKIGDEWVILGDQNKKKNGYIYVVWGTSQDSSTWYEKNISLEGAPTRQLRREMIKREVELYDDVDESDNEN